MVLVGEISMLLSKSLSYSFNLLVCMGKGTDDFYSRF